MQHARAASALAARGLGGRSRLMSLLMALCLFAAIALAIPGFAARATTGLFPSRPRHSLFESNRALLLRSSTGIGATGA